MDIIQELMKYDSGDVKLPEMQVKMKLAKLGNRDFLFPLVALKAEIAGEIQEELFSMRYKKKDIQMDMTFFKGKVRKIYESCPAVFKNSQVQEKFGTHSPYDLVVKLLTPGEIDNLTEKIDELSGFDSDEVEEVKN